jgi:RNA-splicing ligase RtcB
MILQGKFTNAVIFSQTVESSALDQIRNIIDQPFMKDVKVRIMPDVHAGAGICIGYTATINEFVVPNFIGVDIGCGVLSQHLKVKNIDFASFDKYVRGHIPHGMKNNVKFDMKEIDIGLSCTPLTYQSFKEYVEDVSARVYPESGGADKAFCQLGSLGGGNHFISINQDGRGDYWLTIHSGSRNFGLSVANYHQKIAKTTENPGKVLGMEYLTGKFANQYFRDADLAQWFAEVNRRIMLNRLIAFFGNPSDVISPQQVHTIHNYIDYENKIIRKGAVRASKDELLVIPMSMRDGVLLCRGKGNEDWNFSAPHGAGRLMSRSKAKQNLSVDEYARQMAEAGVWTSCIGKETLDESPMAYKTPDEIKSVIGDTVDIIDHWKEVYNFKASE